MKRLDGEKMDFLGLVGRTLMTRSGAKLCGSSFQVVGAAKEKKIFDRRFWWRHVVLDRIHVSSPKPSVKDILWHWAMIFMTVGNDHLGNDPLGNGPLCCWAMLHYNTGQWYIMTLGNDLCDTGKWSLMTLGNDIMKSGNGPLWHWVIHPRRRNVAVQVAEELKTVTHATPSMEERRKK